MNLTAPDRGSQGIRVGIGDVRLLGNPADRLGSAV